jgi:hypothetical protein
VNGLAGEIFGLVTDQERHDGPDVLGGAADASQWNLLQCLVEIPGCDLAPELNALRVGERAHHVDPDVVASPLERGGLRHAAHRFLGGGVGAEARLATRAGTRSEVDDHATARGGHRRVHGLHEEEGGARGGVEHQLVVVEGDVDERFGFLGGDRIVDQGIDPAERRYRRVDDPARAQRIS